MITLAIESSAAPVSVSLCHDGKIIAENYVHTKQTHSETLMPMVENLLKMTNLTIREIDLLAVSYGPGSFTGVRIGVSTIKGLAFASDIPCCGVSTLEAIARTSAIEGYVLCAVMDARCKQVYNANFTVKDGKLIRLCEDRALSIEALSEECQKMHQKIMLCGDGAQICYEEYFKWGAGIAPENIRYQRASSVALLAEEMFKEGKSVSAASLVPAYLRLPQAERELKKKLRGIET